MEEKAQGSLEYLLLVAGAIIVAAVVLVLLSGMLSPTKHATENKLHSFLHQI